MPIDTKIEGAPDSVRGISNWLRGSLAQRVDGATSKVYDARNGAQSGWHGEAADAFTSKASTGGRQAEDFHRAVQESIQTFDDIAAALQRAQADMERIRSDAAGAGLTVQGDTIVEPVAAPAPAAPAGPAATPEAVGAHNAEVSAQNDAHAAKVATFNRLKTEADDVRRVWQQAVQKAVDSYQHMKLKSIFTAGGFGLTGVAGAEKLRASALRREADGIRDVVKMKEARVLTVDKTDPQRAALEDRVRAERANAVGVGGKGEMLAERASKIANRGGAALAVAGAGYDYFSGHKTLGQAAVTGGASFAASTAAGAAIGTAIPVPVLGTALGAVGGAAVGAFTSGAVDRIYKDGIGSVGQAAKEGVNTVGDTGKAIGDVASDAGGAIGSGVKNAWNSIF